MSLVVDRPGRNAWRSCLAVAALVLVTAFTAPARGRDGGVVTITVDQAHVMKMPDGVGTLVVGNPLIADVSVQSGGMVVLTGKGFGMTNLMALDRAGNVLEQMTIQVQGARDTVVVYRGVERESYSCTPKCERRITLGDHPEFFAATMAQSGMRTGQAQSSAPAAK